MLRVAASVLLLLAAGCDPPPPGPEAAPAPGSWTPPAVDLRALAGQVPLRVGGLPVKERTVLENGPIVHARYADGHTEINVNFMVADRPGEALAAQYRLLGREGHRETIGEAEMFGFSIAGLPGQGIFFALTRKSEAVVIPSEAVIVAVTVIPTDDPQAARARLSDFDLGAIRALGQQALGQQGPQPAR